MTLPEPERFAIVLANFPHADLPQSSLRPAVILGSSRGGRDVVVAFVTRQLREADDYAVTLLPGHPDYEASGLHSPSSIRVDRIATIDRREISRTVGVLGAETQQSIRTRLRRLFGL